MEGDPGPIPTRSGDDRYVTVRVPNRAGSIICTLYVGPETEIVGRNPDPELDTRWAHPHRLDARGGAFGDSDWQDQANRVAAARRLRELSEEIWRIGSGAAVFCTEGRHRSPSAVGAFLIDYFNYTPAEVITLLEESYRTWGGTMPLFDRVLSILVGYKRARDSGAC